MQGFLDGDEALDLSILQDFHIEERILDTMIRKAVRERIQKGTNIIESVLHYLSLVGIDPLTHIQLQKVGFLIQKFVSRNTKLLSKV